MSLDQAGRRQKHTQAINYRSITVYKHVMTRPSRGEQQLVHLRRMSVTLALGGNEIKDVLNGGQSDQEHRPHCGGD